MSEEAVTHEHNTIIKLKDVSREFHIGKNVVVALKDIDFEVKARDFIILFGPSGCGKSTLLNTILGLDEPTTGTVAVRDTKIYSLSDDERAKYRVKKIGMVYQMSNWIKSLNVVENVAFPLIAQGIGQKEAIARAHKELKEIGIQRLAHQAPTQLSGGEQQKAGIARALVSNPHIIIADEPTGNLDSTSSDEIMSLFISLNLQKKKTILMVTHNQSYWDVGTERVEMKDGMIIKRTPHQSLI
ncbi:MAG: ABC transporter ATP-binding protein [bacterium]